jgi:hypothetical protein
MSFLDDLDADEMADGHAEMADHNAQVDRTKSRDDGKVLVYCLNCDWEAWGNP